jgi:hypothetical protein
MIIVADLDGLHLSDAEFNSIMDEIDADLRKESDKIPGRELRAWSKFCDRFHISVAFGDPLSNRIAGWFTGLYGDRLNVDMEFGKSFVSVRGDAYRVCCFRFYGAVYVICSVEALGRRVCVPTPRGVGAPVTNLLDGGIEGLTPELARRLSVAECGAILAKYRRMFVAFSNMEGALSSRYGGTDAPYVKEATDDLIQSSESVLLRTPNYGQSNYASLQAAEKMIKSYILGKGANHAKIHKLDELCDCASQLGLPAIDKALIEEIQCNADVRYDSTLVTKDKALSANEAALTVCGLAAPFIRRSTAQAATNSVDLSFNGGGLIDGLMLSYQPPAPPFFI